MPRKTAKQLDREIAAIFSPHARGSSRTVEREKLAALQPRFPVGAQVKVVRDVSPEFGGATGEVVGYDLGSDDDAPLVRVRYDRPVGSHRARSGKYHDDEIVPVAEVSHATKRARGFRGDVHAWAERHDNYDPAAWLYFVLDGTYSVPEMRAAVRADRAPKASGKRTKFDGDVHAWAERHDNYDPDSWLSLVVDGTYSVPEMRAAVLADRAPREGR